MRVVRYLALWIAGGFALPFGCVADLHRSNSGWVGVASLLMLAWMMWTFPGEEIQNGKSSGIG